MIPQKKGEEMRLDFLFINLKKIQERGQTFFDMGNVRIMKRIQCWTLKQKEELGCSCLQSRFYKMNLI
jgi:hypothetical protein